MQIEQPVQTDYQVQLVQTELHVKTVQTEQPVQPEQTVHPKQLIKKKKKDHTDNIVK